MPIFTYVGSGLSVPANRPAQSRSAIVCRAAGEVQQVTVKVTMQHTHASDLRLWLESPQGTRVMLCSRRGGSSQGLVATFSDNAHVSIVDGNAPITGRYRPEQQLSKFVGELAPGEWQLIVEDLVSGDGGTLDSWTLDLDVSETEAPFAIELDFSEGMATEFKSAFVAAARRWERVITTRLPAAQLPNGRPVESLLIFAKVAKIDGPSGILGQAGPTHVRWASKLPLSGVMEFDEADMASLNKGGSLVDVIIHEMGHVLGFGTLWHYHDLIDGSGSTNPVFVGKRAMSEYAALKGLSAPTPVPLESGGGAGTAEGHWSEAVFDDELMTGWLDSGVNPLSRLTVASMVDLGYQGVDLTAADDIAPRALRHLGPRTKRCLKVIRPPLEPVFS